jgi:hypothetical protein
MRQVCCEVLYVTFYLPNRENRFVDKERSNGGHGAFAAQTVERCSSGTCVVAMVIR